MMICSDNARYPIKAPNQNHQYQFKRRPGRSLSLLFLMLSLSEFLLAPIVGAQTSADVPRILSGSFAASIAIDSQGNVFYVGTNSTTQTFTADGVYELVAVNGVVPSNPTVRQLASTGTIVAPQTLAIDSLGDVYVTDNSDKSIKELVAVSGSVPTNPSIRTLASGINFNHYPIAVDANGNLYFGTASSGPGEEIGQLQEFQAINGTIPDSPVAVPVYTVTCVFVNGCQAGASVVDPKVDAAGDVIFNDTGLLKELPANNGSITPGETAVTIALSAQGPDLAAYALAPNGDLFAQIIASNPDGSFSGNVVEVVPNNGAYTTTPLTLYYALYQTQLTAFDLAADNSGNIFVANRVFVANNVQNILELSPGTGASLAPQASLTPASSDFGSIPVASTSSPQIFTLSNAGSASLSISSISLGGANAGNFTVGSTACGAALAAGASCTVSISFSPTSIGSATAVLNVIDAVGTQSSMLTGSATAAAAPQAILSPSSASFGSVTQASSSAATTFTLTNAGNAALALASVSLGGTNAADFTIASNSCGTSLSAAASCTLMVSFTPPVVGDETATLSVVDSVGTQTSTLTGTGIAAPVPTDFSVAASPDAQAASAGSSVNYVVDIISASGTFSQPVSLSASGLPPGAAVTFSPASVTPGTTGATSTMTIQTAPITAANIARPRVGPPIGAPVLAVLLFLPFAVRRRSGVRLSWIAVSMMIVSAIPGCGGGFALPQPSAVLSNAQTYTITITGTSGSKTHSTTVQITIDSVKVAAS